MQSRKAPAGSCHFTEGDGWKNPAAASGTKEVESLKSISSSFRVIISLPLKSWQHVLIEKNKSGSKSLGSRIYSKWRQIIRATMLCNAWNLPDSYQPCIKNYPNTTHYLCMRCYFYFIVSLAHQNDISTLHLQNSAAAPELNRLSPKQQCIAVKSNHSTHVLGFTFLVLDAPTQSHEFIITLNREGFCAMLSGKSISAITLPMNPEGKIMTGARHSLQGDRYELQKGATSPHKILGKWSGTCPKMKPWQR